ncbi:MAG: flippase-like domain-containing protein [Anaerolineales bacterium]|jgi:phosphatidylglycerol lysyltransferase
MDTQAKIPERSGRFSWKRILLGGLIVAFIWLIISHFTEVKQLANTLAQGQWQWVLVAAGLQVIYYLVFTATYQSAFYALGIKRKVGELIPVTLGSLFVNVVAPTASTAGAALFVDDAARRGHSPARAATATLLQLVADYSAFLMVLTAGMTVLFIDHDLQTYEIIGAIILLLLDVALIGVLLLGVWWPKLVEGLLRRIQLVVNRIGSWFKHPSLLDADWAHNNAAELTDASQAVAAFPGRLVRLLLVMLAAYAIDIFSLYVLFRAFDQTIGLGVLLAGFAMGILFWIVSPIPQGIGLVEGVMTLTYTSLGVSADTAAVVSIAFRGLTFWLPLVLGFVLIQRTRTFGRRERSLAESWGVRLVALLTALMGIVNLLSAATPALISRFEIIESYLPLVVSRGGHLTAALGGFALMSLSIGLWRRKRNAWVLTLAVLVISAISHLIKGLDYEEALLGLGLAVWLLTLRPHFYARSDKPSVRQGLWAVVASISFTLLYGVTGFYLLDRHFSINFGLPAAIRQTVVMFTEFYDPGFQPVPITHFGHFFANSIYLVGAGTFAYAMFMLLRPVLLLSPATLAERRKAETLVKNYGRSSLARMVLFDDKSYYFSSGGSVIAYAAHNGAAVALGDPIGPPSDAFQAITGFKALCAKNAWIPAFYQARPDYLEYYTFAGFKSLNIGSEAITDVARFTLSGNVNKGLRSAYNRMVKLGYRSAVLYPPLSQSQLTELRAISDIWLTHMHGTEKRFSLGWFDEAYLQSGPIMVVYDHKDCPVAFANIVSEYQRNEISIDLMRYVPGEHGIMDFMFVSLFEWTAAEGYANLNLGLSALSGLGEHAEDLNIERALHYIFEHVNQFYNFKGLHAFKAKFHPTWVPRYLIYPNATALPTIILGLNHASSGGSVLYNYLPPLWNAFKLRQTLKASR